MLKQAITYTDFDDQVVTEDFYFNISKADLAKIKMTFEGQGGLEEVVRDMLAKRDGDSIMELFEKIVSMAYGIRSADGKRFLKSEELFKEFQETAAYAELYYKLCTDAQFGADFLTGCLPKEIREKAAEMNDVVATETADLDNMLKNVNPTGVENKDDVKVAEDETGFDPIKNGVDNSLFNSPKAEPKKKLDDYTHAELVSMPFDQFEALVAMHRGVVPRSVLNIAFQRKLSQSQTDQNTK